MTEVLLLRGSLRAGSTNEAVLRTAAAVPPAGVAAALAALAARAADVQGR